MAIVREWQLPPGAPVTYLAAPADGTIAYLRNPDGVVGVLDLASAEVTEWPLPPALLDGAPGILAGIAPLRRGYALALHGRPALALFDPAAGEFRLLHAPVSVAGAPERLAQDAVGHVWACVSGPSSVWRLEPWSARGLVWPLPPELGSPRALAASPSAVWLAGVREDPGAVAGRVELRASRITLYDLAAAPPPAARGIAVAPRGDVWVSSSGLYRIAPGPEPSATRCAERVERVAVDAAGTAWFTAPGRLGRVLGAAGPRTRLGADMRPLEAEGFDFAVTAERAEARSGHAAATDVEVDEAEADGVVEYRLAAEAAPFDVLAEQRRVFYSDSARDVIGALAYT